MAACNLLNVDESALLLPVLKSEVKIERTRFFIGSNVGTKKTKQITAPIKAIVRTTTKIPIFLFAAKKVNTNSDIKTKIMLDMDPVKKM